MNETSAADRTATFSEHKPLLFSIAYRMLGSVMDAEDMVQETFLRWQDAAAADVRAPKSYLSTVVTRLCIDQLRSARTKREQYIGPWLPEPLVTEETAAVDEHLALSDSLSMAFLVLLERLSPVERAVFLLHEVFEYDYPEIARIVDKSEANCRQLMHRAKEHVTSGGQRFDVTAAQIEDLTYRFLKASGNGNMQGLIDLLTEDAVLYSDGGGKVPAALNPIYGSEKIARFFIGLAQKMPPNTTFRIARVNGSPGFVCYMDGRVYFVAGVDLDGGRVQSIRIVNNPDKLRHVPGLT